MNCPCLKETRIAAPVSYRGVDLEIVSQLPGQPPAASGLTRGDAVVPWIEREIGRISKSLGACETTCFTNSSGM
jgi:hypothetical protein